MCSVRCAELKLAVQRHKCPWMKMSPNLALDHNIGVTIRKSNCFCLLDCISELKDENVSFVKLMKTGQMNESLI